MLMPKTQHDRTAPAYLSVMTAASLLSDRLAVRRQPLSRLLAELTASASPVGLLKGEKRQLREVEAGAVKLCAGAP